MSSCRATNAKVYSDAWEITFGPSEQTELEYYGENCGKLFDVERDISLVSGSWGRNWSLEEVQALLGHSSMSITQRYAHLCGTALERAAMAAQSAFQRPLSGKDTMQVVDITELTVGLGPTTAGLQIRRTDEGSREDAEANGHARPQRPFYGGMVLQ